MPAESPPSPGQSVRIRLDRRSLHAGLTGLLTAVEGDVGVVGLTSVEPTAGAA